MSPEVGRPYAPALKFVALIVGESTSWRGKVDAYMHYSGGEGD